MALLSREDIAALLAADKLSINVTVVGGTVAVDTSLLATQASLAALVTANHADLASVLTRANLLAADTSIATGNGSLTSIKTDLDTLLTAVATAALQASTSATAHTDSGAVATALATLHTDLAALIAANHTDEAALATALALLHTDSAAILAKQPTTPALESGGNLAAILTRQSDGTARSLPTIATSVTSASGGALVASQALKTNAGTHFSTSVQLDAAAPTASYWILFVAGNAGVLPSNGAVTHLHAPQLVAHTVNVLDARNVFDDTPNGIAIPAGGAFIVCSSTRYSLTITTSAYLDVDSAVL